VSGGCTLNGLPTLGSSPEGWAERVGVDAPVWEFDVSPDVASSLAKGYPLAVPLKLSPGAGSAGDEIEVAGLVCIGRAPGHDPNMARVRITDRRYVLPRIAIRRRYNVRRTVGSKRLKQIDEVPENDPLADEVAYHPASLNKGRPWTAEEILDDIFRRVERAPVGVFDPGTGHLIDIVSGGGAGLSSVPVEGLELSDSADDAIRRVLASLPGMALKVNARGQFVVFSRVSGREADVEKQTRPESVHGGHVELIDNGAIRPEEIHVLFSRKCELRFDFEESGTVTTDARYMGNVLPVPDYQIQDGARTLAQGTWIEFQSALDAWNGSGGLAALGPLTLGKIRKAMVPFLDPWTGARLHGLRVPDADWMARIAAVEQHFRQTFRINRRWMDRIAAIEPYRVALLDPTTGTRAPAVAYSDYALLGSARSMYAEAIGDADMSYVLNVARYPTDGRIGSTTKPAACRVTIEDADQGILRLEYLVDTVRLRDTCLPSKIEIEGDGTRPGENPAHSGPSADPSLDTSRPPTFDAVSETSPEASWQLTEQHKAAVILTAVPAYPNDETAFHRVVVRPRDVMPLLPQRMRESLASSYGPRLEIIVPQAVAAALVAWNDDRASEIEKAFGIGVANGEDISRAIEPLTLNAAAQVDIGNTAASLNAVAVAYATAAWCAYADHFEGSRETSLRKVELDGWMSSIEHTKLPDGRMVTRVEFPGARRPVSIFGVMDSGTRRVVLGLVQGRG